MKKIYVGNLPWSTTDEALGNLFEPFGQVLSARVITDRETGRSRGFGFVEMAEEADALNAISAVNGSSVEGRALRVNEAQERAPRGGGGSYRGGGGQRDRY
ncbi:MAG: RNA-binding protein [Proteobacteria bacterium]|nr:RNA-binding protein [Pseudomonadota bacterium]